MTPKRWALLLIALISACGEGKGAAPRKRPPPLVMVARPTIKDVSVTLSYSVDIRPIEQAELQSKISGYVERVNVDRGDRVKKGQLLVEIRPSDLPKQVSQAREQVGQTDASYRLALENARRSRELYRREMISKAELDQVEAQLQMAQSARGGAESGLGAVTMRLSETRILAPFSGWVTGRYLDPGALVQPGQNANILTLMRIDEVRVFLRVPELDAPKVHPGQPATVTVDALPGKSFPGSVDRVPPALDPATRSLEAQVRIPNRTGILKPGMYGRATLTVEVHPRAVVLPVEAVLAEDKKRSVYVVDQVRAAPGGKGRLGTARQVAVQIGFDGGEWLEISQGLSGQDQVVVQGMDLIVAGEPVAVQEAATQ